MSLDTVFPCSFAQRRLWFLQMLSPGSTAYSLLVPIELDHAPNVPALQRALDELVSRHEPLRTRFGPGDGDPVQIVSPTGSLPLGVVELHGHPDAARRKMDDAVAAALARPFDLAQAPLARAELGVFDDGSSLLVLVVHHIIVDGQSVSILLDELNAMYVAHRAGTVALLPEAPVQYGDFAAWQRQVLSSRRLETLTAYWRARLEGVTELDLAPPTGPVSSNSLDAAVHAFVIDSDLARRVHSLATESGTTVFAVLLAAWSVVVGRLAGQTSVPIGVPVTGRPMPELERVVGPFVNSVVMCADLSGSPTFRDLVSRTATTLADDLTHADMPFDLLVERLNWPRHVDRNPIFQVMFQLVMREGTERRIDAGQRGGTTRRAPSARREPEGTVSAAQLDLSCIQFETLDGTIEGGVVYASHRFEPTVICSIVDGYLALLAEAVHRPTTPIGGLPLMSAQRRATTLAAGRGEVREAPVERLDTWVMRELEASPNRTAIVAETATGVTRHSAGELVAAVNRYASELRARGVGPGKVVAIALPRGFESVTSMLAALRVGAAYLFLDPCAPHEWRSRVLSDADAAVVVVEPGREGFAGARPCLVPPLDLATDVPAQPVLCGSWSEAAYFISTSGSTGEPKVVAISHLAIVNHMRWILDRFELDASDVVLQRTPLTFDASVWELYAPLLTGATLVLSGPDPVFDPGRLARSIREHRVTTLQVVPSILRALVQSGELTTCASLRRLFCGGEQLSADLRNATSAATSAQLCNLYGPSETTIDATYHVCERDDHRDFVPIGRPIANAIVRVMDEAGELLPPGVAGELWIGGAPVGLGYVGQPAVTAKRFVDTPDGRMFRTGDRARLLATGELEMLGRLDDQVKVRGFRVEPAEVEKALTDHPDVDAAAVVVQRRGEDARLVAFVVASGSASVGEGMPARLHHWLRDRLPRHLVPSTISCVDSLPRTSHGKVDRLALTSAPLATVLRRDAAVPRTPLQRTICDVFAEVLDLPVDDIDSDFFDLGGHSLLVLTLRQRLIDITQLEIDVVDVFEFPTPRALAASIESRVPRAAVDVAGGA